MVNIVDFAKRLEKLFAYYGLNASSFAEKIDVGRASISHLLSGRNKPSLDFVMKVVQTFPEVELYWLLNGKGNFPAEDKSTTLPEKKSTYSSADIKKENNSQQYPESSSEKDEVLSSRQNMGKKIQRVLIIYEDGTFEAFNQS